MIDGLSTLGNASKIFHDLVETIDTLIPLPKKVKDAYRELGLGIVVDKMNERLFGRYRLIHALERFGQIAGLEQDFESIRNFVGDRIVYLKEFNKKIEAKLKKIQPRLAADLIALTDASISRYEWLMQVQSPQEMAQIADAEAKLLREVASYIWSV
jgi:hypothetical protein